MNKMKIFISQGMHGRDEQEIEAEHAEILSFISEKFPGVKISDISVLDFKYAKSTHPASYLGLCLQMMAQADLVIFANDWTKYMGCWVEHAVCGIYHIPYEEVRI